MAKVAFVYYKILNMKLTDQTVMRLCHKPGKTLSNAPDNHWR